MGSKVRLAHGLARARLLAAAGTGAGGAPGRWARRAARGPAGGTRVPPFSWHRPMRGRFRPVVQPLLRPLRRHRLLAPSRLGRVAIGLHARRRPIRARRLAHGFPGALPALLAREINRLVPAGRHRAAERLAKGLQVHVPALGGWSLSSRRASEYGQELAHTRLKTNAAWDVNRDVNEPWPKRPSQGMRR